MYLSLEKLHGCYICLYMFKERDVVFWRDLFVKCTLYLTLRTPENTSNKIVMIDVQLFMTPASQEIAV